MGRKLGLIRGRLVAVLAAVILVEILSILVEFFHFDRIVLKELNN